MSVTIGAENAIQQIENNISKKHVLQHPFYQAWNQGSLTMDALQDYAAQYYQHVAAFPSYLSAVHSNTSDLTARRTILQNLIDEEAGSPNHPELWLQFAEGLGLSKEEVINTECQPETRKLIDTFQNICRHSYFTDGVSALYAYESQIPEVSESKIAGLKDHYSITDPKTLAYFQVHIAADEVHRSDERAILSQYITTASQAKSACAASELALDAIWNLLSGVCHRHGIVC